MSESTIIKRFSGGLDTSILVNRSTTTASDGSSTVSDSFLAIDYSTYYQRIATALETIAHNNTIFLRNIAPVVLYTNSVSYNNNIITLSFPNTIDTTIFSQDSYVEVSGISPISFNGFFKIYSSTNNTISYSHDSSHNAIKNLTIYSAILLSNGDVGLLCNDTSILKQNDMIMLSNVSITGLNNHTVYKVLYIENSNIFVIGDPITNTRPVITGPFAGEVSTINGNIANIARDNTVKITNSEYFNVGDSISFTFSNIGLVAGTSYKISKKDNYDSSLIHLTDANDNTVLLKSDVVSGYCFKSQSSYTGALYDPTISIKDVVSVSSGTGAKITEPASWIYINSIIDSMNQEKIDMTMKRFLSHSITREP